VETQSYRVGYRASCDRTSWGLCGVGDHAHLMKEARKIVRLQQDAVDAILHVTEDDYNFRDSVCNKMRFSLTEEGFQNATQSLTHRVMKCYIRRAGAVIRQADLNTLDKWRPADLQDLSQKYLGKKGTLSGLLSDIRRVQSSSGNAPMDPLKDPQKCRVEKSVFETRSRMVERHVTDEDQCIRTCQDQEGCHCVEYYPNGGCVLVSKGAGRYSAPLLWWDKPKTIRLERCPVHGGHFNTC